MMRVVRLLRLAGRWWNYVIHPARYARFGFYLLPRIAGGAFQILEASLGAVAAAAGTTVPGILGEVPVQESEQHWQISRMSVTAPTLVTGNNTNSGTLNVRQMRAGAQVAVVGTLALVTGVNLAAETPVQIPTTGTPDLLAGDVLEVQYVQIGTGLALPAGTEVKAEIN
jgi:hypothetical protein